MTYKWNWNAPFIISPHNNTHLYIAANKVLKSEDRGMSWTSISDDLTAKIDRNSWPVMGKYWSADAVAKDVSISLYGMVVSFSIKAISGDIDLRKWCGISELGTIPTYHEIFG